MPRQPLASANMVSACPANSLISLGSRRTAATAQGSAGKIPSGGIWRSRNIVVPSFGSGQSAQTGIAAHPGDHAGRLCPSPTDVLPARHRPAGVERLRLVSSRAHDLRQSLRTLLIARTPKWTASAYTDHRLTRTTYSRPSEATLSTPRCNIVLTSSRLK